MKLPQTLFVQLLSSRGEKFSQFSNDGQEEVDQQQCIELNIQAIH